MRRLAITAALVALAVPGVWVNPDTAGAGTSGHYCGTVHGLKVGAVRTTSCSLARSGVRAGLRHMALTGDDAGVFHVRAYSRVTGRRYRVLAHFYPPTDHGVYAHFTGRRGQHIEFQAWRRW